MGNSEESRLKQAVNGNVQALTSLLHDHASCIRMAVAGQIPRRWRSVLSEQDVIQQTFADAIRDIERFHGEDAESFLAWLRQLARCNLRDAIRLLGAQKRGGDRNRVVAEGSGDSLLAFVELLSASGTTPSGHAVANEARIILEKSIGKLPKAYRRVVQMYDLDGKPVEQVAKSMKRSPGAVFMLRARAHQRLKELMGATTHYFSG